MNVTPTRNIGRARTAHVCDWCGERIDVGQPYSTWFMYSERAAVRLHPECLAAMRKADIYDGEWDAGAYNRGCWCAESPEECTCKKSFSALPLTGGPLRV